MAELPPCGMYRTVTSVAGIDAGRLVYFHNHGDPGPGLYLPETWINNRAKWQPNGYTVPPDFDPKSIKALVPEGFYRVKQAFYCCEKKCTQFQPDSFVQLGYNGNAKPLVFMPEFGRSGIAIPDRGSAVDDNVLSNLIALRVAEAKDDGKNIDISLPRGFVVH